MTDYRIIAYVCFCVYAVSILIWIVYKCIYKMNKKELIDYLESVNYFEVMHQEFEVMFGSSDLYRDLDKSSQLVSNFDGDKRMDYLIKYFGFVINDEVLKHLNKIYAVQEKGESYVQNNSMKRKIFEDDYIPSFSMTYTSPQGRSTRSSYFEFDTEEIIWLYSQVRKILSVQSHSKYQRAAMTPQIRESILRRDNWTCRKCGNSIYKEPNLLLEVDHIIPISKGGKTEPNNLQTLCWRCNRNKSDKILIPTGKENIK